MINILEDSNIIYNEGVRFLNVWKTTNNVADLGVAIQYFKKAIAVARIESIVQSFEIAETNLKLAESELANYHLKKKSK